MTKIPEVSPVVSVPQQRREDKPIVEKVQQVHKINQNKLETRTYLYDSHGKLVTVEINNQTLNLQV